MTTKKRASLFWLDREYEMLKIMRDYQNRQDGKSPISPFFKSVFVSHLQACLNMMGLKGGARRQAWKYAKKTGGLPASGETLKIIMRMKRENHDRLKQLMSEINVTTIKEAIALALEDRMLRAKLMALGVKVDEEYKV